MVQQDYERLLGQCLCGLCETSVRDDGGKITVVKDSGCNDLLYCRVPHRLGVHFALKDCIDISVLCQYVGTLVSGGHGGRSTPTSLLKKVGAVSLVFLRRQFHAFKRSIGGSKVDGASVSRRLTP